MQYVVALSSLFGIVTGLLVGLYIVSRLVMVAARAWLLPPVLARISPRTQTPVFAQLTVGVVISLLALFVKYNSLSQMVNFGALWGMWVVCNVFLFRRYYPDTKMRFTQHGTVETMDSTIVWRVPGSYLPLKAQKIVVIVHLVVLNLVCICTFFLSFIGKCCMLKPLLLSSY